MMVVGRAGAWRRFKRLKKWQHFCGGRKRGSAREGITHRDGQVEGRGSGRGALRKSRCPKKGTKRQDVDNTEANKDDVSAVGNDSIGGKAQRKLCTQTPLPSNAISPLTDSPRHSAPAFALELTQQHDPLPPPPRPRTSTSVPPLQQLNRFHPPTFSKNGNRCSRRAAITTPPTAPPQQRRSTSATAGM